MREYSEELKDARWQKKRLQIFEERGWECDHCGATRDLQVHHNFYSKGLNPWEYPNWSLSCLCGNCHRKWHEFHKVNETNLIVGKTYYVCERVEGYEWDRVRGKYSDAYLNPNIYTECHFVGIDRYGNYVFDRDDEEYLDPPRLILEELPPEIETKGYKLKFAV